MKGIRIVVTYNCNIMCSNCLYKCGPHRKGIMNAKNFKAHVEEALQEGYDDYLIIDGGEPLLHSDMIYKYLKTISNSAIKKYVVTNGFWGNYNWFYSILEELKKEGLQGIIFEYDFFHSVFIEFSIIKQAIKITSDMGIDILCRARFLSGGIRQKEDLKTLQYIKEIGNEFTNTRFLMDEINNNVYIYGKSLLTNEKLILYGF